jgi:hypothetical protein
VTPLDLARAVQTLNRPSVIYCHPLDLERVELGIEIVTRMFSLPSLRAEVWDGAVPRHVLLLPDPRVPQD